MTKDMTQGSPLKLILAFAVPLMLGSLFQQFYNLADTIIVGRFVGVEALAAVGSVGGLNYLVLGFVNGIACGFSIPISWTFGAKDYVEMRRYTANAVWLSVFFAAVLTVVTVAMTRSILVWTNTPDMHRLLVLVEHLDFRPLDSPVQVLLHWYHYDSQVRTASPLP